jgi:hypothetical protein
VFDPGGPDELSLSLAELAVEVDPQILCNPTCVQTGPTVFRWVEATVLSSEATSLLLGAMNSGATAYPVVHAVVPNPSGPGEVTAMLFFAPDLRDIRQSHVSGRTVVTFSAVRIRFQWLSTVSEWDVVLESGSGCTVPANEAHVELSGNPPTELAGGEIESVHTFGVEASGVGGVLRVDRKPPNACQLRGAASVQLITPRYDRLWTRDSEFPLRQSVETLQLGSSGVHVYTLRIRSGVVTEQITIVPASATLETRSFDEATGAEVSSTTVPLSF